MLFFLKHVRMIYIIVTLKQHLMWEFKIWLIVFRLNTTDRSNCRNHLCFHSDSCTDLWDLLLWGPPAISWWGKALESLSLPRTPRFFSFSYCTQSPKTLLNGTCLHDQSIQHQSVGLGINLEMKSHPTQHALPTRRTHTPTRSWHTIARVEPH